MSPETKEKPEKLIYMANQIGRFFASQGEAQAAAGIAGHMQKFWDPRMRLGILRYVDSGGEGLDPAVREAVIRLKNTLPHG